MVSVSVLLAAPDDRQQQLAEGLADGFEIARVRDGREALALLAQREFDVLLLHVDGGAAGAVELLAELKRGAAMQRPAVVAIAREADVRSVVAIVRAGAFDVLPEDAIKPRELAHLVRNAAFSAQSTARLASRREPTSQEVLVVGSGDGIAAVVLLLESSGITVRHVTRMPTSGEGRQMPRTIIVDLAAAGNAEELLKLLAPS